MNRFIQSLLLLFLLNAGTQTAFGQWDSVGVGGTFPAASVSVGNDMFVGVPSTGIPQDVGEMIRSTDGGVTWTGATPGSEYNDITSLGAIGNTLYAGAASFSPTSSFPATPGLFRSTNNGDNWERIDTAATYAITTDGNTLYVEKGDNLQGIYLVRSADNGATWDTLNFTSYFILGTVPSFIIAASGSNVLDAELNPDYPTTDTEEYLILSSSDSGNHWITTDTALGRWGVGSLTILDGTYLVGSSNGLFRSSDHGATWQKPSAGIGDSVGFLSFAITGNDFFALTSYSLYLSTDVGIHWTDVSAGQALNAALIAFHGSDLYAFSDFDYGSTVWRRPLSQMLSSGVELSVGSPHSFSMFPNPASIRLQITSPVSDVRDISLYDMLGREVATYRNPSGPLDVSCLKPGRYEAIARTSSELFTAPVIIQE